MASISEVLRFGGLLCWCIVVDVVAALAYVAPLIDGDRDALATTAFSVAVEFPYKSFALHWDKMEERMNKSV